MKASAYHSMVLPEWLDWSAIDKDVLALLLAFKCAYFLLLIAAILAFPINDSPNIFHSKRQTWTKEGYLTFQSHFTTWDSEHYLHISEHGYERGSGVCAFYPLWPMLVRYTSVIFGGNDVVGGVVLANVTSIIGLYLFFQLVKQRLGVRIAWSALWLILLFPGSLFYQFNYSESLFLLLMMIACLGLFRGSVFIPTVCAFLLPLTRGPGIFCVVAFLFHNLIYNDRLRALAAQHWESPKWTPRVLKSVLRRFYPENGNKSVAGNQAVTSYWLVLAPIYGWLLYFVLMLRWTGNPFSGFEAQKEWGVQSIGNLFDISKFVIGFLTPTTWHEFSGSALDRGVFLICVIILPTIYKVDRIWFWWAIVLGVLPAVSGTFVSYTRFASVTFPIFIGLAVVLSCPQRRSLLLLTIIVFCLLHILLLWRFVNYSWAG